MPWLNPTDCPDHNFLGTGELQYRDRFGQFRVCGGCNADDWFTFQELRDEAITILNTTPSDITTEECYLSHTRFRQLCDWCLTASGIDPQNVSVRQALRLLFARQEDDVDLPAPLAVLNQPPAPRHPSLPGSSGLPISDKASLLAALVGQCQSLAEVEGLMARPMRELLTVADDLAWASRPQADRDKAQMLADARSSMARIDGLLTQIAEGNTHG